MITRLLKKQLVRPRFLSTTKICSVPIKFETPKVEDDFSNEPIDSGIGKLANIAALTTDEFGGKNLVSKDGNYVSFNIQEQPPTNQSTIDSKLDIHQPTQSDNYYKNHLIRQPKTHRLNKKFNVSQDVINSQKDAQVENLQLKIIKNETFTDLIHFGSNVGHHQITPIDFKKGEFVKEVDPRFHTGRVRIFDYDKQGNIKSKDWNTAYYPKSLYMKTNVLAKVGVKNTLSQKQLKKLGRKLNSVFNDSQVNLGDRPDIPLDYITGYLPRQGENQMQNKVIKEHSKAWDNYNKHNRNMLIREMAYSQEDLQEFKEQERQLANRLYRYARGTMHKKFVFDQDMGLAYAYRVNVEAYSKIMKVLSEISARDPYWKPQSVLDFGCGLSVSYQAVNKVFNAKPGQIRYTGIDHGRDMIELSHNFVYQGNPLAAMPEEVKNSNQLNNIRFINSLPAWDRTPKTSKKKTNLEKFDIVIVQDVLWQLDCNEERYKKLYELWQRTGKYLIVIDKSNKEGHILTQLARGFILSQGRFILKQRQVFGTSKEFDDGYTFAPCPHDRPCQSHGSCSFDTIGKIQGTKVKEVDGDYPASFTYAIMKKGNRIEDLENLNEDLKHGFDKYLGTGFDGTEEAFEDRFNALNRKDSKAIHGALPWPRLLTLKRKYRDDSNAGKQTDKPWRYKNYRGKIVKRGHKKDDSEYINNVRICMPSGQIYNGNIHAHTLSSKAWETLKRSKFGDRLPWFTFNQFRNWIGEKYHIGDSWVEENEEDVKLIQGRGDAPEETSNQIDEETKLKQVEKADADEAIALLENRSDPVYSQRKANMLSQYPSIKHLSDDILLGFNHNRLPKDLKRVPRNHILVKTPYINGKLVRPDSVPLMYRFQDRKDGFRTKFKFFYPTHYPEDDQDAKEIREYLIGKEFKDEKFIEDGPESLMFKG